MSFRGRGGGRGGGRGRGGRGRGGGRGGRFQHYDYGPPEYVTEVGSFVHPCEEDLVCKGSIEKVPYFNAPIYLENKSQIGKVDEIFGPMNSYYFSVKLLPDMKATSFKSEQKFFIDPMKLLPLGRFLPRPKTASGKVEKRGGGRGGGPRGRGGRGGFGRGGGFRGGGRGGFGGRGGGRGFRGGFSRGRGRGRGW